MGELDYYESEKDDIFYCGWSHFIEEMGYSIGQTLTAELANGRDTCSVNGVMKGAFGSSDTDLIITKEMYERLGWKDRSIGWLWIDCQEQNAEQVRGEVENLISGMEHVEMPAYKDKLRMSEPGVRMMKLSCYLFLAVIGLICMAATIALLQIGLSYVLSRNLKKESLVE